MKIKKRINNAENFLIVVLLVCTVVENTEAQIISLKGGLGVYTLYENTFHTGKVQMKPTPVVSVSLTWPLDKLFSLSWENSFRLKLVRADFIGIDSVSLNDDINFYREFDFFNFDSKVLGIFSLYNYDQGNLFAQFGTGISIPLSYKSNKQSINTNVVLRPEYFRMIPSGDSEFFFDGNLLTEIGIGAVYTNLSLSANLITELLNVNLYEVGRVRTSLIEISFLYNF